MKVKICGITNPEDAAEAVQAGADALGFIFHEASPRYITPAGARLIIDALPPGILPVVVFVNASRDAILRTIDQTGIACVQLHGEEKPAETLGLPVLVWKAFRVHSGFEPCILKRYQIDAYLLDTYSPERRGGTGRTFDWSIAVAAKQFGNIVLSGGITPEVVAEAVRTVHPYAIDVNSGVESKEGKRDRLKLQQLFANIPIE